MLNSLTHAYSHSVAHVLGYGDDGHRLTLYEDCEPQVEDGETLRIRCESAEHMASILGCLRPDAASRF